MSAEVFRVDYVGAYIWKHGVHRNSEGFYDIKENYPEEVKEAILIYNYNKERGIESSVKDNKRFKMLVRKEFGGVSTIDKQ